MGLNDPVALSMVAEKKHTATLHVPILTIAGAVRLKPPLGITDVELVPKPTATIKAVNLTLPRTRGWR